MSAPTTNTLLQLSASFITFSVFAMGLAIDASQPATIKENTDQSSSLSISLAQPPLTGLSQSWRKVITGMHSGVYDDWMGIYVNELITRDRSTAAYRRDQRNGLLQIVAQAPLLESTYTLACGHLAFQLGLPEDCRLVTDAGMAALPKSPSLPLLRGFIEAAVLDNDEAGRNFFRTASQMPSAPKFSHDLAVMDFASDFWESPAFSSAIAWLDSNPGGDSLKQHLQQRRLEELATAHENQKPFEPAPTGEDETDEKKE